MSSFIGLNAPPHPLPPPLPLPVVQLRGCIRIALYDYIFGPDVGQHDPGYVGREGGEKAKRRVRSPGRKAVHRPRRRSQHAQAVRALPRDTGRNVKTPTSLRAPYFPTDP